jgi:8-oxo-dGTP diphosphatase
MALLVLRHAHALNRLDWDEPDELRPLSDKGLRQAAALDGSLDPQRIVRVVSSPALRCRQTVEPLAAKAAVDVEEDDSLEEGQPGADALQQWSLVAAAAPAGDVLVCSHGDVIEGAVAELAHRGIDVGPKPRCQKGSTWIVEVDPASEGADPRSADVVSRASYLPPPSI